MLLLVIGAAQSQGVDFPPAIDSCHPEPAQTGRDLATAIGGFLNLSGPNFG
jgi:hypothetical protein